MLCYLNYVKKYENTFYDIVVPNSKFKLHRICKFCHTYELQYTNCFFSGQRLIKLSLNSGKFELVKFCSKT